MNKKIVIFRNDILNSNRNNVFTDYNFLKFGHECHSSNEYLGNVQSERECAQLCIAKTGCKVFLLESGQNYSTCIWEKTINTSCPEGWKESKNMNAYELKGMFIFLKLRDDR